MGTAQAWRFYRKNREGRKNFFSHSALGEPQPHISTPGQDIYGNPLEVSRATARRTGHTEKTRKVKERFPHAGREGFLTSDQLSGFEVWETGFHAGVLFRCAERVEAGSATGQVLKGENAPGISAE